MAKEYLIYNQYVFRKIIKKLFNLSLFFPISIVLTYNSSLSLIQLFVTFNLYLFILTFFLKCHQNVHTLCHDFFVLYKLSFSSKSKKKKKKMLFIKNIT